jgi:hypothetical protein
VEGRSRVEDTTGMYDVEEVEYLLVDGDEDEAEVIVEGPLEDALAIPATAHSSPLCSKGSGCHCPTTR